MSCILAAIDLGPTSSHVIDTAIDLATAFDQQIIIVYANEIPRGERADHAVSYDRKEGVARELSTRNNKLDALTMRVRNMELLQKVVQSRDEPDDLICSAIGQYQPAYVVMGAKDPSALHHMVVGSIPAEVMRRTQVPVVFVKEAQAVD